MTKIDGKAVTEVAIGPLAGGLVNELDDIDTSLMWVAVGRAEVQVEGGGRFDGLVMQLMTDYGRPEARRVVVVWERSTRAFRTVPA